MKADFDRIIDRKNTHSMKWDALPNLYGIDPDQSIAMWVADMDFRAPKAVNDALQAEIEHGIHGYYTDPTDLREATQDWFFRRHGWSIEPEWVDLMPGIVCAVNIAVQAFCRPGDKVIIQNPVYHPFAPGIRSNGCEVLHNELVQRQGRYEMDFDGLEATIDPSTKMLILCSPHNPGGRVWTKEELERLCEICLKNDILIVSDEVHHDLVYPPAKHTVTASLSPEIAQKTITCTAASKTFNLAGGMTGNVIISNPDLRKTYLAQRNRCGIGTPNRFGPVMSTAAYRHGEAWLEELLVYLKSNRDLLRKGLEESIPGARVMPLEATYLAWVDVSEVPLRMDEIERRVIKEARIAVNKGRNFGPGGDNWLRFNFACPRAYIEQAIERLHEQFKDIA